MTARRERVAELDIARKAVRRKLKRSISTAKQEITPGALVGQLKRRKRGQVERLIADAKAEAVQNRDPILLGGLVALAAGLITHSVRRWKRHHRRHVAEPAPLTKNFDGERL